MSKPKLNIDEILNDVDKLMKIIENIDGDKLSSNILSNQSKNFKNYLEKKYKKYLDSKE